MLQDTFYFCTGQITPLFNTVAHSYCAYGIFSKMLSTDLSFLVHELNSYLHSIYYHSTVMLPHCPSHREISQPKPPRLGYMATTLVHYAPHSTGQGMRLLLLEVPFVPEVKRGNQLHNTGVKTHLVSKSYGYTQLQVAHRLVSPLDFWVCYTCIALSLASYPCLFTPVSCLQYCHGSHGGWPVTFLTISLSIELWYQLSLLLPSLINSQ